MSDATRIGGEELRFPVSFELKIIYEAAATDAAACSSAAAAAVAAIPGANLPSPARDLGLKGRFGRLALPVSFNDIHALRAAYAAIAEVRGVKALI